MLTSLYGINSPYKKTGQNFNLDFLRSYTWNHAETFTVVSSHENLQLGITKKHRLIFWPMTCRSAFKYIKASTIPNSSPGSWLSAIKIFGKLKRSCWRGCYYSIFFYLFTREEIRVNVINFPIVTFQVILVFFFHWYVTLRSLERVLQHFWKQQQKTWN